MGRNRSKVRKGERVLAMVTRNALYEINGSVLLKPCVCGRTHRFRSSDIFCDHNEQKGV